MRNTIRTRLEAEVPAVEGRIYQPYIAVPTTPKPYLVVKFGPRTVEAEPFGLVQLVEVWIYTDPDNWTQLDSLAEAVVNTLDGQELVTADGVNIKLRLRGYPNGDFYDDQRQVFSRRVEFVLPVVRG